MLWHSERAQSNEENVPGWFEDYTSDLRERKTDLLSEVERLSTMDVDELKNHLGGNIRELPYEILETMFIDGSEVGEVAEILRKKRKDYVDLHPEKSRGIKGVEQGIITYDGRFIPQSTWETATDSEKRGALVGSTCFHYNSDTPGMGSDPKDRF